MKKVKCPKCKKEIEQQFSEKEKMFFFFCPDCAIGGKDKSEKEAEKKFLNAWSSPDNKTDSPPEYALTIPKTKNEFMKWAPSMKSEFIKESADYLDMSAREKMIVKNLRYVEKADLKKAWKTPEGVQSIIEALYQANEMGATLPDMGFIIPFGGYVEYIPSDGAFKHALTTGKNPPFKSIDVNCIYENDQYDISRDSGGNFLFALNKIGLPRGEVIGIVVTAIETESGRMIGEAYDEPRLMEKAKKHSTSYGYYLTDMMNFKKAISEGKNHIMKWDKKYYEHDIVSPYVGADKPERLKVVACKSFFRPFMKVRDANAVAQEETDISEMTEKKYVKTATIALDETVSLLKEDVKSAEESGKIQEAEFVNNKKEPVEKAASAGKAVKEDPKEELFSEDI